jgi:hypothetical protein
MMLIVPMANTTAPARHIGNAVLREDARGARLAKERKDSPRRIDAALAGITPRQHLHLNALRPREHP